MQKNKGCDNLVLVGIKTRGEFLAKRICDYIYDFENEKLLESIIHYFDGMAEKTGTLWEMGTEDESCNHGFASYVMILIDKLFN